MKILRFAVGNFHLSLTWCLVAGWCATTAGQFLKQGSRPVRWPHRTSSSAAATPLRVRWTPPATAPHVLVHASVQRSVAGRNASAEAAQHIEANIQQMQQEAATAVATENASIASIIATKLQAAKAAIEKEVPAAGVADTQALQADTQESEAELQAAMQKSTDEATKALADLKDKTSVAVHLTAARAVADVVKETEEGADYIANHSAGMAKEAAALTEQADGAAVFSNKAAQNAAVWVKEMPTKDAAHALEEALKSQRRSMHLRHEYDDIKRIAKLTGNLALDTIRIAQESLEETKKAQQEATLTMEQAAQNALLLNTIRQQTSDASKKALKVLAKAP